MVNNNDLEEYLMNSKFSRDEQRKIRKALRDFFQLFEKSPFPDLEMRRRDYYLEWYEHCLRRTEYTESTIRATVRRLRDFFHWFAEKFGDESRIGRYTIELYNIKHRRKHEESRSFSVLIPIAMLDSLKILAKRSHCSTSKLAVQAISEFLDRKKEEVYQIKTELVKYGVRG